MKHISALLIKFIMIAIVLELVLLLATNLTFGEILWIAVAVTIVAYLIGDLFVLPRSNNTVATLVDIGLAFITIYMYNYLFNNPVITVMDALIASVIIGIGEWVFHKYMETKVLPSER